MLNGDGGVVNLPIAAQPLGEPNQPQDYSNLRPNLEDNKHSELRALPHLFQRAWLSEGVRCEHQPRDHPQLQ